MKGQYFIYNGDECVVLSDAMMHPEGIIQVVAKKERTNEVFIIDVSNIRTLDAIKLNSNHK